MGWAYGKEILRSWGGAQGVPLELNSDPSVEPHSPATIVGCDWLSSQVWLRAGALGLGGWGILGLLCHSIMFLWPLERQRSVGECETPPRRPDYARAAGVIPHILYPVEVSWHPNSSFSSCLSWPVTSFANPCKQPVSLCFCSIRALVSTDRNTKEHPHHQVPSLPPSTSQCPQGQGSVGLSGGDLEMLVGDGWNTVPAGSLVGFVALDTKGALSDVSRPVVLALVMNFLPCP